jgi:hypothetical protein
MKPFNLTKSMLGLGGLLLAVAPACSMMPPAQTSGALSRDGVEMAVVGERCTETVETDWPGANLVQTTVEVQVGNSAPARSP